MNIQHYLRAEKGETFNKAVRVISTMESDRIVAAVSHSLESNTVQEGSFRLLGVNTGDHTFALLHARAVEMGVPFRISVYPIALIGEMDPVDVSELVAKANFAWADASKATFVEFGDWFGWGLDPLGIEFDNCKKLQKRLTEITRVTGNWVYDASGERFTMREFATPEGDQVEFYDGANAISPRFAAALGFKGVRGNLRVLTELGLIKGDCHVIEDLDVDVLYHTENLKSELRTTGWVLATVLKHDPDHMLRHNAQTSTNFSFFLNKETMVEDLRRMYYDWKSSIEEGGELFEYLQGQSQAFEDPIAVDLDLIQGADTLDAQAELLASVGIPAAAFSNITYTRTGALVRRMEAGRKEFGKKTFNKMFIPASNAFLGAVTTYEAATKMCGVEFEEQDGSRTFFDPHFGIVMPGRRFKETYELHGGWDLDDSASMFLIKLYCSDPAVLEDQVGWGVVDGNLVVPATAEEAVYAGLVIRNPNGPGEYSIEAISADMPWNFYDESRVNTFDLVDAPKGLLELRESVDFTGIPTSVSYDGPFDRSAAADMIFAHVENPGVGRFANLLMAWVGTFGTDDLPTGMIGGMEDVVDCVQQTADAMAFQAINANMDELWQTYVERVLENRIKVDTGILETRVPQKLGSGEDTVEISTAIYAANLAYAGPQRQLMLKYDKGIDLLREASMTLANRTRNNLDFANKVKNLVFGAEMFAWCENFMRDVSGRMKKLDREKRQELEGVVNPVVRREIQTRHRLLLEAQMDEVVAAVVTSKHDSHKLVLALYKFITTPRRNWPHGDVDRIFVQPSSPDKVSMMRLFIEACAMEGLLDD